MRGLKPYRDTVWSKKKGVASFTDAWIETIQKSQYDELKGVASFTDAWSETF